MALNFDFDELDHFESDEKLGSLESDGVKAVDAGTVATSDSEHNHDEVSRMPCRSTAVH